MTHDDKGRELAACPFCASIDINTYACDDDSFIKTIVAECSGCWCRLTSSINWGLYSASGDRKGYEAAWKAKIAEAWNRRATVSTAQPVNIEDDDRLAKLMDSKFQAGRKAGWNAGLEYAATNKPHITALEWLDQRNKATAQPVAQEPPHKMVEAVYMALHFDMSIQNPDEWGAAHKACKAVLSYLNAAPAQAVSTAPSEAENKDLERFGYLMADLTRHVQPMTKPGKPTRYRVIEDCEPVTGWFHTPAAAIDEAIRALQTAAPQDKESGK